MRHAPYIEAPAPTEAPAPAPTMQVLLVIAPENFRDEEYAEPRAVFEAAGYTVVVASASLETATGMLGMEVQPDLLLADVQVGDYDAVVFIGGMGARAYWDDPQAHRIAQEAVAAGKVVGAICIAPVILARAGVLEGKQATVFKGNCGELEAGGAICDSDIPVHHFGTLRENPEKSAFYLELAKRKTELEPRNAQAWAELADCAINAGDYDEALRAIDRALILEPFHPDRRLTAGWLLFQCGQLNQADAQLAGVAGSGCADDRQLAESCHLRAQIALRRNEHDVAGRLLSVALHLFPDNGHYHNTLGVWHLTAARGDQARTALNRACGLLPGVAEPWLNLGKMYAAAGQPRAARDHLRHALAIDPGCEQARHALRELEQEDTGAKTRIGA